MYFHSRSKIHYIASCIGIWWISALSIGLHNPILVGLYSGHPSLFIVHLGSLCHLLVTIIHHTVFVLKTQVCVFIISYTLLVCKKWYIYSTWELREPPWPDTQRIEWHPEKRKLHQGIVITVLLALLSRVDWQDWDQDRSFLRWIVSHTVHKVQFKRCEP